MSSLGTDRNQVRLFQRQLKPVAAQNKNNQKKRELLWEIDSEITLHRIISHVFFWQYSQLDRQHLSLLGSCRRESIPGQPLWEEATRRGRKWLGKMQEYCPRPHTRRERCRRQKGKGNWKPWQANCWRLWLVGRKWRRRLVLRMWQGIYWRGQAAGKERREGRLQVTLKLSLGSGLDLLCPSHPTGSCFSSAAGLGAFHSPPLHPSPEFLSLLNSTLATLGSSVFHFLFASQMFLFTVLIFISANTPDVSCEKDDVCVTDTPAMWLCCSSTDGRGRWAAHRLVVPIKHFPCVVCAEAGWVQLVGPSWITCQLLCWTSLHQPFSISCHVPPSSPVWFNPYFTFGMFS